MLNTVELHQIEKSIDMFTEWLEEFGDLSYDRMDFFASKPGIYTKRLFYKNKYLGGPFAFFALIQETFFPTLLKLYAKPRREAIGDAHFASGFLNLYRNSGNKKYLIKAEGYLNALRKSSIKGYSGDCWGYTFPWETSDGFWPAGVPLITITPYAFWAFKEHYELTGNNGSLKMCHSIAQFGLKDLRKLNLPNGTICSSYSPVDSRFIINANTYRAAMLLDAYKLFGEGEFLTEANESIDFVLSYQEQDGKWYYEAIGDRDRFVDNFHTCFVLRNLFRTWKINPRIDVLNAIENGYSYYRKNLFRPDNSPLHFSEQKYNKLRKYEMYDYAEGILLGVLLKDQIKGSFEFSIHLASELISKFQLKDGHFVTRVTSFGNVHKIPYLRWPQSQLFYSLTELLIALNQEKNK
jgi:hypothetical protein